MHKPRKRFGQNFLTDQNIIARIAQLPHKSDVIEIGPGQGAITELLLQDRAVTAIEIDRDLAHELRGKFGKKKFELIQEDVLKVDFNQFAKPLHVIGNLPYNITSPILFHLIKYRTDVAHLRFMVQKEVADRIMSPPGSKIYGRLSVMIQSCFEPRFVKDVSPKCFFPAPKVESTVFDLVPKPNMPDDETFALLEEIVRDAFSVRRKQIKNTLAKHFSAEELLQHGIDPKARAEQINTATYLALAATKKAAL